VADGTAEPTRTRAVSRAYSALAITTALDATGGFPPGNTPDRRAVRVHSSAAWWGSRGTQTIRMSDGRDIAGCRDHDRAAANATPAVDSKRAQACGSGEWLVEKPPQDASVMRKLHYGVDADRDRSSPPS